MVRQVFEISNNEKMRLGLEAVMVEAPLWDISGTQAGYILRK